MTTETLACTYAALLLSDSGLPTTAENITKAVNAANVEVRATLPILFSRFLEKKTVAQLFAAASSAAPSAAPAAAAAAPAAGGAAPAAAKKEEKKEEEADDEMGFGLFD